VGADRGTRQRCRISPLGTWRRRCSVFGA